mgnify:CR=1 FL=1
MKAPFHDLKYCLFPQEEQNLSVSYIKYFLFSKTKEGELHMIIKFTIIDYALHGIILLCLCNLEFFSTPYFDSINLPSHMVCDD